MIDSYVFLEIIYDLMFYVLYLLLCFHFCIKESKRMKVINLIEKQFSNKKEQPLYLMIVNRYLVFLKYLYISYSDTHTHTHTHKTLF